MKLLLVDDERMVLELLMERVGKVLPKAELFAFSNAREAMEFAARTQPDIAFLDINMRILDGVQMATELQRLYPHINIIFCTGYTEYMQEAFDMYCSGYLLKPVTEEKIRKAISHLRYPVEEMPCRVFLRCYGNFEIFCDGVPVVFKYNRTKELLAYLVDRNGADCTTLEIMAALFGDDVRRSYFNHLRADLLDTLHELGVKDIIRANRGKLGLNKALVRCDYYDYLDGRISEEPKEYMAQYSFLY